MNSIVIRSKASLSSLGHEPNTTWENYKNAKCFINICCFNNEDTPSARLAPESQQLVDSIRKENSNYRRLDKTVIMAIAAARMCLEGDPQNLGINLGSSRGATQLLEKYHKHFLTSKQRLSPLASPTTTLGNISSWVANDLGSNNINLSHSITCSTALHSILNACAWINSGMNDIFLAGASESPLTDFTVRQMKSLGIYSKSIDNWPCKPLHQNEQKNNMVLGEGASVFQLEKDNGQPSLAKIIGIGYSTEKISHPTSISKNGESLQKSMRMALQNTKLNQVDAIVMHAPGTIAGDQSELNAIKIVFGDELPNLVSTKFQTGHTLGASGGLSLDLAIEMIQRNRTIQLPYPTKYSKSVSEIKKVLINAIGFGGNAVSLLISK